MIALLIVKDAIDHGMRAHDKTRLGIDVLVYLALNGLAWIMQTTLVRGLTRVGQDVVLGLRQDLFDHLTTLSLRYFSQQKAGWIISRLTSDVDALSDVLSQGLTTLVVNTLTLLAAIAEGRRTTFETSVGIPCESTSETASTSLVRRAMIQPAFCCEK